MSIILYDIYTTFPGHSMSFNTWKTRYCLNFKSIPHKTEWLEISDLEPFYKKHNIATTVKKPDGSPHYTVPLIYDPATDKYINDSAEIAAYLDEQYPDTPKLFPHGTRAIQELVDDAYQNLTPTRLQLALPLVVPGFTEVSRDFILARARSAPAAAAGAPTAPEMTKEDLWAAYREGNAKVAEWYAKSGGPYLMGETLSWGDFVIASHVRWARIIWGEESDGWKEFAAWNGGRWVTLLDALEKYARIC